ncbi:3-oxoacid CoA-transferase subunit B [Sneathiella sp. CAU 1612]|uniref:Acetate CoA-transferase YdiF n=1 Tax=Sneathiella sedimenti TaxID=2816034 RepID=A0ABS3F6A6_9PROT|nr:3-oxoacid CoA-transferase [Sneathiella sedimenti]MBO0334030.1 3-oxoacid CoA-transferase subunit B [Sneathiella sedimenti]
MKSIPQITAVEAASKINSGDVMLVGGFGMTGNPVNLLHALAETEIKDLTYVGNNVGEPGLGGGKLLRNGQLTKAIGSYFTSNREVVEAALSGSLEIDMLPQGTLAEALRSGGAGLGGFYTPTAVGTDLAKNHDTRIINGKEMVYIEPLRGNVALIRAWRADTAGNLQYRMTESNFNVAAATAADLVIAEVEEIVSIGTIPPEHVHTQCCFVDYLVQASITPEELGSSASVSESVVKVDGIRMAMVEAALAEIKPGDVVNLGIGIPTLVGDFISPEDDIIMHTENGMLGVGPRPVSGSAMSYPVNAGKVPVTALLGASYFDSAVSFSMIRGGHIDVAIMGGLQVDEAGNLANWSVPGKPLLGVGGAMDLASGAKKLIVVMSHCNKDGSSKVLRTCNLPLTAEGVVDILITDLAVFRFDRGSMTLVKLMPELTLEEVSSRTEAYFNVALEAQ